MFGLIGLAMARGGIGDIWTILGGIGAGFITMLIVAWVVTSMQRLQSDGTLRMENAIGKEGKVYLTIPEGGTGKVSIAVQGSLQEFEAVSADKSAIPTGTAVRVTRLAGSRVLVVERIE
jgi:membrane protein implicated in regulation of membrane protease activity